MRRLSIIWAKKYHGFFTAILLGVSFVSAAFARDDLPAFADIHVHFNWDQKELISAEEAILRLRKNNVRLAVVMGTPTATALELRQAGGKWVLPLFSPYIEVQSRHTWYSDARVLERARAGLVSGRYFGIGEVHLISGIGPRRDNAIFTGLLELAEEFNVPMLVHTEASDYRYFLPVCKKYPKVRFQWAHAGGFLNARQVQNLMQACPNVWTELSARDPWHYGNLVDESGKLQAGWQQVFEKFPDRFMVGSDPVWNAHQIDRWYEADAGWDKLDILLDFHRSWLKQLPKELEKKLRLTNAEKFYATAVTR